jgi:sigma-B regulation protein RsbU (phosphoserine phosphatase)
MANLQAAVRTSVTETLSPASVCMNVNRLIARNNRPEQFITFFFALFDNATHTLLCTNAGHNPPMLFRRDGTLVRLDAGGTPLGIFADQEYGQQALVLGSGDRLLLFTDGVTESCNAKGEEFGEDRLIDLCRPDTPAPTLHQRVVDAVKAFSADHTHDDVTVVTLSVL